MDVTLLRWPTEDERREAMAAAGVARLLLVEDGCPPPPLAQDCLEDWIRIPATELDVQARTAALAVRAKAHKAETAVVPEVDADGVMHFAGMWASLPPLEARLTRALLGRYGAVVKRELLIRSVWPGRTPGRNALDVHVLRLRKRVAPLGLAIRTIRSRGYLLEAASEIEANTNSA